MKSLSVYMNGYLTGSLIQENNGGNTFVYHPDWLDLEGARPLSLSLPLRREKYEGAEVFNFFDNLLPDNRSIRERIAAKYRADSLQPFDLLYEIGRDCVGALLLLPEGEPLPEIRVINGQPLNAAELSATLKSYQAAPATGQQPEGEFRISIAGAQEKTALLHYEDNWAIPLGVTPTTHIFKLPIGSLQGHDYRLDLADSVENEWLCMRLAQAYGLNVAHSEMVYTGEVKALAVERFDRRLASDGTWIVRLPQEDFCQTLGLAPSKKYEGDGGPGIVSIMSILLGSDTAKQDREHFMRTQVFFWLLAASDGHAKNFSLFILPGGGYRLTPLYDILSCYPMLGGQGLAKQDIKLAMALSSTGKGKKDNWLRIFPRHFLATAKSCGFDEKEMQSIMTEFYEKTPAVLAQVRAELPEGFPQKISDAILGGVGQCYSRLGRTE